MKPTVKIVLSIIALSLLDFSVRKTTPVYFDIPKGWPKPQYDFTQNPLTEEGFALGRELFYDPILSRDNTISCASCHLQASAFTHIDHDLSHGIDGRIGTRNSKALMNLAWRKTLMWDGGVNHLDVQPLNPIENPNEMDEKLENVVRKLQQTDPYPALFAAAFGDEKVTGQRILKALSQFELQLVSANAKYDQVMRGETTFNTSEQNGYRLFKTHCASCHSEPLFESERYAYNGLEPDPTLAENGRLRISGNADDYYKFKVPTLRNSQYSFPYMHDGRFKTLTEVVRHYNSGLSNRQPLPKELAQPMNLSDDNRVDLVAFLKTLSDKSFVTDPRFAYPRKKLQSERKN
ncbi:cytochrome-c peroxidase [Flavobacterium sp.]|uniref:cytochrome-c peroxidase n=1 Tax=Flavobacterium sp. TaxID=239 RepID=UPI0039E48387